MQNNKNNIILQKITNKIEKNINFLKTKFIFIEANKKKFLNHPKILEYLFSMPIIERDTISESIKACSNDIIPVILSDKDSMVIDDIITDLYSSIIEYLKHYEKFINKLNILDMTSEAIISLLPFVPNNSNKHIEIKTTLKESSILYYIEQWSFTVCDKYINARKPIPYIYKSSLTVDYFVLAENMKNEIILFAIEFDKKKNVDTYLKQYYLRQMNIHLLYLDNKSDIKKKIKSFIIKILKNTTYIISNGYIPKKIKTNKSDNIITRLRLFSHDYNHNHNVYLKYYSSKILPDNFNNVISDHGLGDEFIVVPKIVEYELLNKKNFFS